MASIVKKLLLAIAVVVALLIAFVMYAIYADQRRLAAATNPCEHDCLLDSGGVDDCRALCVGHPTTYGPAAVPSR